MSADAIRRVPLGSLASVLSGRTYPDDVRTDDPDDGIQLFSEPAQPSGTRPARVRRSELGQRAVVANDGEVVIGLTLPNAGPSLVEGAEEVIGAHHALLRPVKGSPVTNEWLFVWASSTEFGEQIAARARTMRARISVQELRGLPVPLPSRELQLRAFDDLRALEVARRIARRQSEILDELRSALADRAVATSMSEDARG